MGGIPVGHRRFNQRKPLQRPYRHDLRLDGPGGIGAIAHQKAALYLPEPAVEGPVVTIGRHFQIVKIPSQAVEGVVLRPLLLRIFPDDAVFFSCVTVDQIIRRSFLRFPCGGQHHPVRIHTDLQAQKALKDGKGLGIQEGTVVGIPNHPIVVADIGGGIKLQSDDTVLRGDAVHIEGIDGLDPSADLHVPADGNFAQGAVFHLEHGAVPEIARG